MQQNAVMAMPTISVCIQRCSGDPRAAIMKLAERRDDQAERTNDECEEDDRERDEERSAQMIALQRSARQQAGQRNADGKRQHQAREQPRRRARTELEAAHARQIR